MLPALPPTSWGLDHWSIPISHDLPTKPRATTKPGGALRQLPASNTLTSTCMRAHMLRGHLACDKSLRHQLAPLVCLCVRLCGTTTHAIPVNLADTWCRHPAGLTSN